MEKHPYGTGVTDYQAGIDFPKLRRERLAKAQDALRRHGMAAALLTRPENIRYTTSIRGHEIAPLMSYALVFADQDPILFELGDQLGHQAVYAPWIRPENLRYSYSWLGGIGGLDAARKEAHLFAQSIKAALDDAGLAGERLGFDVLDDVARAALGDCGIELVAAQPAMLEARATKTQDEVACIRTAIAISNNGFASLATFRPGLRERDAAAAAHKAMLAAGAESAAGGLRTGFNTFDVYHINYTDRIVDPGDLAYMLVCGTSYAGYKVCVYRSFIVGRRPNDRERAWYEKCRDRIYSVIGEIKPGATTADAAKHFLPASTWGYDAEQPLLVAEVGHGIGQTYEPPVISRLWSAELPQVFEPGMVIAVESREGERGYGGVRLEEMVLVTETGHEILTTWPSDEIMPIGLMPGS
jgi:Xaa-Pro aminopeptidase